MFTKRQKVVILVIFAISLAAFLYAYPYLIKWKEKNAAFELSEDFEEKKDDLTDLKKSVVQKRTSF